MDIFKKAYLEITNVCNLSCPFCKGTDRKKEFMTAENFALAAKNLRKVTSYLYLHILGEPTLHPNLEELLNICKQEGFRVVITTNGTLLPRVSSIICKSDCVHKINISLHALEVNETLDFEEYLEGCAQFCKEAANQGKICVFRLWNGDRDKKYNSGLMNEKILSFLEGYFDKSLWKENRGGFCFEKNVFLEFAERFDWRENNEEQKVRCYGLRDQIGVLCDGRVVPCCIDCDGAITLGNIFKEDIFDIINSQKAKEIAEGFRQGKAIHPYCKNCGFVRTRLG